MTAPYIGVHPQKGGRWSIRIKPPGWRKFLYFGEPHQRRHFEDPERAARIRDAIERLFSRHRSVESKYNDVGPLPEDVTRVDLMKMFANHPKVTVAMMERWFN